MDQNEPLSEHDKCPKCGSRTLERDPENDVHCWGCGTTFPRKVAPRMTDQLLERHRFYEDNKAALLSDVQSIGASATAKRWKINGASFHHVLLRWDREAKASTEPAAVQSKEIKEDHLPGKSKRHYDNDPWKRHLYYETNKDGIISDLLTRGRTATKKKWGIPNGATIGTLERRWLTPDQIAIVDQMTNTPAVVGETISENGRLPHFPAFSMAWPPEVQLKWLEIYEKLAIKEEVKKE